MQDDGPVSTKKLELVTRMWFLVAHIRPHTAASGSTRPLSSITLMDARRTPGATATTPAWSPAAAIVPATCVPWTEVDGRHAFRERSGLPSRQLADRLASTTPASSGC